jgi:hypothetical protein
MRRYLFLSISIFVAFANLQGLAQEPPLPAPAEPVHHPEWLASGPPCQSCTEGGYFYDSFIGHNRFSNWYVRAEVLFLEQSTSAANRVVVQTDVGATPVITTEDFDFPMAAGLSLLVGRRLDSDSAWELSYFGLHNWSSDIFAADAGNLDLPGTVGVGTDFDDADEMDVLYQSRLNNVEFNLLRDHTYLAWIAGFRYVNWEEEFNIAATNGADLSNYNTQTSNNMFGGQFGARAFFYGPYLQWELTGKAGLFGNVAQQRQRFGDDDDTLVLRDTSEDGSAFSFVGDVNLSAHYRLNRVWSIRAGYNILGITGLALAPDQLDFAAGPAAGRNIDVGGSVFLHGANIGIEGIW